MMKIKKYLTVLILLVLVKLSFGLEINYKPSSFEIYNNGHAVVIEPIKEDREKNVVIYNGNEYILKEIFLIIRPDRDPELNFIHVSKNPSIGRRDKAKDVLVIAVKISPDGKVNPTFNIILSKIREKIGIKERVNGVNVINLLPAKIKPFKKETKPISIPIPMSLALWVILENPLAISPEQFNRLTNLKLEIFTNSPLK